MDFNKIKAEKAERERTSISIYITKRAQKRLEVAAAAAGVARGKIVERLIEENLQ